jgi:hypothetical protein
MKYLLKFKADKVIKWAVMVVCAGWVVGAAWSALVQSTQPPNPYMSYEQQIAKCRAPASSEARYNCTSQIMLTKDNESFNKTLTIILPPLALLFAYFGVTRALTTQRERIKSQRALAASRRRMDEWRTHLRDIKSAAATHRAEAILLHATERPSGTPSHLARRR